MIELTIGREESNLKRVGVQFYHVDLVSAISSISSWLSFDRFFLPVETLGRHVIRSSADVAESSISLLAKGFGFEGKRLRRFEKNKSLHGEKNKK